MTFLGSFGGCVVAFAGSYLGKLEFREYVNSARVRLPPASAWFRGTCTSSVGAHPTPGDKGTASSVSMIRLFISRLPMGSPLPPKAHPQGAIG